MFNSRPRRSRRNTHRPHFQQLEKRQLLAGDIGHNFVEAEDVNLDGQVSAIDALVVINHLSKQQADADSFDSVGDISALRDVDNSGKISAVDALRVINRLSRGDRSSDELEPRIDRLADAILTENLPEGMRPQTAQKWLTNLEQRVDSPLARRGAFSRLDANSDGEITEGEVVEDAWERIVAADADASGDVTHDELKAARSAEKDAQRPTNNEGPFARLDANEDGVLTQSEVSNHTWNRISQADRNENGEVTLHELQANRDENEDRVQRPSPEQFFTKLDLNEDGSLTEDEVSAHVWNRLSMADANGDDAVTLAEVLADRVKHEMGVQMPTPEDSFAMLDINNDAQLTVDEVSPGVWSKLATDDEDANAGVTVEELASARRRREGRIQDADPEEQFVRLDVNEDGQITSDEVSRRTWRRIARSDANGDGAVTLEELIGSSTEGSMYVANALVHHIVPDQANGKSVIMVPGHNLSSSIYLTTPDGREGWAQQLANEGYQVYVINDPNFDFSRGFHVEGFTDVPTEDAPPADPNATQAWGQDIWRRWGFGTSEGNPYADARFPTDDFDEFEADYPFVSRARRSFTDSIVALMDIVGPATLIAHSAGGPNAVGAALARPELIDSLVLVEPTGPPTADDFPALAGISMLGIYGDYVESRNQTGRKEATEAAAELFTNNGGVGEVISLPEDLEVYGNSHLMMQDNNSEFIFGLMNDWLDANVS